TLAVFRGSPSERRRDAVRFSPPSTAARHSRWPGSGRNGIVTMVMFAKTRVAVVSILSGMCMLLGAPSAHAGWLASPIDASAGSQNVFSTHVASGPNGTAHVTWDTYDYATSSNTVDYNFIDQNGQASTPVHLSNPAYGSLNPVIASDSNG